MAPEKRQATILRLLDEIEAITLNVNSYYEDNGYKELVDSSLAGKLRALRLYADAEGWGAVVAQVDNFVLDYPEANAITTLEAVLGFLILKPAGWLSN